MWWIRVFAYLVFLFASVFVLSCVFVFVFECNCSNTALHCCVRCIRVQQEGAPPDSAHQGIRPHCVAFAYFALHLTASTINMFLHWRCTSAGVPFPFLLDITTGLELLFSTRISLSFRAGNLLYFEILFKQRLYSNTSICTSWKMTFQANYNTFIKSFWAVLNVKLGNIWLREGVTSPKIYHF